MVLCQNCEILANRVKNKSHSFTSLTYLKENKSQLHDMSQLWD